MVYDTISITTTVAHHSLLWYHFFFPFVLLLFCDYFFFVFGANSHSIGDIDSTFCLFVIAYICDRVGFTAVGCCPYKIHANPIEWMENLFILFNWMSIRKEIFNCLNMIPCVDCRQHTNYPPYTVVVWISVWV